MKFTREQTIEILEGYNRLSYMYDTNPGFVDGSLPLSHWDTYIEHLGKLGIDRRSKSTSKRMTVIWKHDVRLNRFIQPAFDFLRKNGPILGFWVLKVDRFP